MANIVIMLITVIMVTGLMMMVIIIILTKVSTLAHAHPIDHAHDGHRHQKECQPWLWPPCHHVHPSNHAHVGQRQHSDKSVHLGSGLPGRLCLSGHRPLQLDWEPSVLAGGGEDYLIAIFN